MLKPLNLEIRFGRIVNQDHCSHNGQTLGCGGAFVGDVRNNKCSTYLCMTSIASSDWLLLQYDNCKFWYNSQRS